LKNARAPHTQASPLSSFPAPLPQIEYAMEAVKQGSAVVGLKVRA
jgi:20S proteasome alpha/beta subunit